MLSLDFLDDVRRMNKRQLYYQVLNFGMIVSSALMIWKGLMVVTGSESPIVVVLSGSMEPAFHRGDLLFLTNRVEDPIRVGEIVVFRIEGREIPIVHRVLKIHEKQNGHIKFLTKGDNNAVDDRGLYKQGQHWLEKKDVVGRARGFVPYIGIVTILMNDYPKFKYAVLFLLGLFVLVHPWIILWIFFALSMDVLECCRNLGRAQSAQSFPLHLHVTHCQSSPWDGWRPLDFPGHHRRLGEQAVGS
ncbi:Signal peptidase complex catalytic subunit SEC11A [Myotis brandtii]|uniref:Signal peptidase complex catalytic subunit SEC11 n=1 Tax=Myotis brandtii TaxID=109478 RepID=S7PWE3_MYOBR|nr:Signal peptidase complex catalytic subunit SEC11A [Myotis brandtii]